MRTGKTLSQLAAEIERQTIERHDYIAPTARLEMIPAASDNAPRNSRVVLDGLNGNTYGINDLGHRQIGEHTGIPAAYYDRMLGERPDLLATNVNTWFKGEPANRMVRTLDGNVRAFLSDKFRPMENADLAEAVIPLMLEKRLTVVSCEITERRLYIKAVDEACVREIRGQRVVEGRMVEYDHVSPTLCVSNSEVGMGTLSVEVGMLTHECRNMAIFREKSMRKYHVGKRHELAQDLSVALLSHKTRALTDAALWSQVGDVVRNAFDPAAFDATLEVVQGLRAQPITGDVVKVVELASKHFGVTEGERKGILSQLIAGADLSRYGLMNAFTRAAEDLESYDRATDFERIGGEVIALPANDWKRIAEAA